ELAAVLGAGQPALLAQHLEQGVVGGEDDRLVLAVDAQLERRPPGTPAVRHAQPSLSGGTASGTTRSTLGGLSLTPGARTPRTRSSAHCSPMARALCPPSGRNQRAVQFSAPRMVRADTLGSVRRKRPATVPSSITSRKCSSYSSRWAWIDRKSV